MTKFQIISFEQVAPSVSGDMAVPKNVPKTVLNTVDIPQVNALESVPKVSPENHVKIMNEVNIYFLLLATFRKM